MHFSYRGFEQHCGARQLTFVGSADKLPDRVFQFTIELTSLSQHGVSLQEIPGLCFQLLTHAAMEGEGSLTFYEQHTLSGSDLQAFTAPRRALAEARSTKKAIHLNRPKPSQASQPFSHAIPE